MIRAGLLLSAAMVALLAASQLINYGVFNLRITALDADTHASVFGIVSLLAGVAVAAAVAWRGSREQRRRTEWFVLAALVAALVVVRTTGFFNLTIEAPLLAGVFGLLCLLTWRDPFGPRTVLWAALVLLAMSLVLHQVGLDADALNYSNHSWAYQLDAVAKHGTELAGWILIATGIIAGRQARAVPRSSAPESLALEMESVAS